MIDAKEGRPVPSDFVEARPWLVCFRLLSQDDNYWNEQVRHPATSWLAAGGRGAPMASSEALALAHFPGLSEGHETESGGGGERDDRRRQANRDKRLAKRKRIQSERGVVALQKFGGKGKGKGQGKDQAGEEICYSWAKDNGPCAGLAPGSDCKCKVKRVHRCMLCLSPGHNNLQCSKK